MQFPESWLREFCNPSLSTQEIADTLTMGGLEVENLRPVAPPFDITTGPLTKAWGFFRGEGRVPSDEEIAAILQNVGTHRIIFDEEDHLVYFAAPGMEIDFGAIGKFAPPTFVGNNMSHNLKSVS